MNIAKPLDPKRSVISKITRRLGGYKLVLLLLVAVVLWAAVWSRSTSSPKIVKFVFGQTSPIKTENGRVNVLLLGVAGGGHDGPNLTDTIMVASLDTHSKIVTLISLPRDLWLDNYKNKVNALYEIGLARGNGLGLAREEIGKILGISIPYAMRMDFSGFVKAVDLVGGVEVDIPKSFDDYDYPLEGHEADMCGYSEKEVEISDEQSKTLGVPKGKQKALIDPSGNIATASSDLSLGINYTDESVMKYFPCRYDRLSFKEGKTSMNGELALKFVRSRHGNNGEGSDFARSRRQQLVLRSFRSKVLSLGTLTDPKKIIDLLRTFGLGIDTNISQRQYLEFISLIRQVQRVNNFVIDGEGENPLLITPPPGDYGSWVLTPPHNDFSRIQQYVSSLLTTASSQSGEKR